MADRISKKQRSKVMRSVKSKGNRSTEIRLIEIFKERGIKGWRRNYKLPGKPDFVFPKLRIVLFADGCFWHGHDCRNTKPATNVAYWQPKIQRNMERDSKVRKELTNHGWYVISIWECEIKKGELDKLQVIEDAMS